MSPLLLEIQGPIVTLIINRPESRNPLGEEGDGQRFAEAAAQINANREIRCAILTGAGPAFSAGGNLKAMRERSGGFAGAGVHIREQYRDGIHRIIRALWGIEVPLIAAINGPAIGLGNDVACLADIRIAADTAIFGATFLKIGLVPGDGGAWILPRVIGQSRAAELFFTADTIDAQTALAWGLVSKLCPPEALMSEARALAERVCRQPPDVLRMTKRLMREAQIGSFESIMEMSGAMQALAHTTADHQEALAAFFEKRPPAFRGE
jgi:enoyl-CoA hydratase/carnithine racemase